jgi:hypothetical protein
MKASAIAATLSVLIFTCCKKNNQQQADALVVSGAGDITNIVTQFRDKLGTLNTTTGVTGGRREINWDAVPDSLMGLQLAADFFNPTAAGAPVARQRGLVYSGGDIPVVSKTNFADINPAAAPEFATFSGSKTFAVINAFEWQLAFRVPGQATTATVQAFGAVFIDVDKPSSAFIEFFSNGNSIGKYFAPVQAAGGKFSFVGVYFNNQKITDVKIGHEGKLNSGEKDITQGGTKDLVIFDDFIYSEPIAK